MDIADVDDVVALVLVVLLLLLLLLLVMTMLAIFVHSTLGQQNTNKARPNPPDWRWFFWNRSFYSIHHGCLFMLMLQSHSHSMVVRNLLKTATAAPNECGYGSCCLSYRYLCWSVSAMAALMTIMTIMRSS